MCWKQQIKHTEQFINKEDEPQTNGQNSQTNTGTKTKTKSQQESSKQNS
jgi:hypothetical protein